MFTMEDRPKNLNELCGNKAIKEQLATAFRTNTLPRCILFTGEPGTGKTTCSGILRNLLHVENINYYKYDLGSDSGIDNIRNFTETVTHPPFGIDQNAMYELAELHALNTKKGQDVLLETLENIPEHVYVVATTNQLEKIQKTVRDRFTIYRLSLPSEQEIIEELILPCCKKHEFKISKDTAKAIIAKAGNVPRTVMTLLYQIHKLPAEQHLKFVDSTNVETSNVAMIYYIMKKIYRNNFMSDNNFNSYLDLIKLFSETNEDWESKRCILLKMCEKDLLSPKDKYSLDFAHNLFESFKEPCYTNVASQFASNLYKLLMQNNQS